MNVSLIECHPTRRGLIKLSLVLGLPIPAHVLEPYFKLARNDWVGRGKYARNVIQRPLAFKNAPS